MLHTSHLKFTFIVRLVAVCLTAMMATSLFAEQLTVKYAAQNYEGPPRFKVQAYNNGSSRPVWSSKSIKAERGFDTKKFGTNRASLFWQTITFQVEPSTDVDYFRIRFLNDHAAADPSKGDRNLFVRWIEYRGERYPASKGKKSANCDQKTWVMACAGSLDIMVNNDGKNKETYGITNVCGYTFSNG